jgi:hypothetical protein
MAVILRRMLGIGKLPDEMRAQVDAEGVLFLAEFVPVTYRFSGAVPGKRAVKEVRGFVGALALTSRRVLGTLSTTPKRTGRAIDQRWDAAQAGTVTAEISAAGIKLGADIGRVDPRFRGHLELKYKAAIPEDVLSMLPTRLLAFDVPAEYVLRTVGVAGR